MVWAEAFRWRGQHSQEQAARAIQEFTGIGSYPGREWVGALRRLACAGFGGGDPGMDPGMDQEHRGCGRFAKKIYPKAICLL